MYDEPSNTLLELVLVVPRVLLPPILLSSRQNT